MLDWALVANPAFPAKTIGELVALAKPKPGEINFASGGVGSAQQIAMELLMARSGIKLTHVPYRGVTPALNDVVAGVVPVMFTAVSVAAPYIPDGKLRVLATTGRQRSTLLPDVPTVTEAGLEGYDFKTWMALLAPKDTPAAIVDRLHRAAVTAVKDPRCARRWRPGIRAGRQFARGVQERPSLRATTNESQKSSATPASRPTEQGLRAVRCLVRPLRRTGSSMSSSMR